MTISALSGPLIAHSAVAVVLSTLVVGFAAGWLGLLSDYWRVGGPLALIVFVISENEWRIKIKYKHSDLKMSRKVLKRPK